MLWAALASVALAEEYPVTFAAALQPDDPQAAAYIRVEQNRLLLEELRLRAPEERYSEFEGDGKVRREGDRIFWRVPAKGGKLRYRVQVDHKRSRSSGYDALVRDDWALMRLDDLFPPAAISQADGSRSRSRLVITVPDNWKILTRYPQVEDNSWRVDNPARKFDRPTGWLVAGRLGIRRDNIGGVQVTVAGPLRQGVQRVAMLGLLRWTLPGLLEMLDKAPEELLVVSAGDPMWRGGLSGPDSLFVNAELPMLSEDGTSTLVHETVHALLPVPAADEHDWIDEGLAEYLTLKLLVESGTISRRRFHTAIERFRKRGQRARTLVTDASAGATTARAVALFHDLDHDLRKATKGKAGIRELARELARQQQPVDFAGLRALATRLSGGRELPSLSPAGASERAAETTPM